MDQISTTIDQGPRVRAAAPPARSSGHRCCPACGVDNAKRPPLAASNDPWRLKSCAGCEMVYLENAPCYEELVETFAWEKTCAQQTVDRRRKEPLVSALSGLRKRLARHVIRMRKGGKVFNLINEFIESGKVLDVGCGDGQVAHNLERRYTPFGIEISKKLATDAQQVFQARGGHVVHQPALRGLDQFKPAFFDGVLMRGFLEHEREPAAVLAETWRVLRPAGCILIKMPNYACWNRAVRGERWCGYRFPDHVNYFTPRSLTRLLEDNAFVVARCGFFDRLPTNDNMWLVARKAGRLAKQYRRSA